MVKRDRQTGDDVNYGMWILIVALAGIGLYFVLNFKL